MTNLTAAGDDFEIIKSDVMVAETLPLPILTAGHTALSFEATNTAGKNVKFPVAYKGRMVMLDFWATWCGPCRAEIPNIVSAYQKFHDRGFDILGVSLDRTNAAPKLAAFTQGHGMVWPQIYEGKFWLSAIAQQYAIDSIPHAFLVGWHHRADFGPRARIFGAKSSSRRLPKPSLCDLRLCSQPDKVRASQPTIELFPRSDLKDNLTFICSNSSKIA